jgi:hypothetical protein
MLEKPERSGAYALNSENVCKWRRRVRECLDLYLCNRRRPQRRQSQFHLWHSAMRRKNPWPWRVRFWTRTVYQQKRPEQKTRAFNICRGSESYAVAFPGVDTGRLSVHIIWVGPRLYFCDKYTFNFVSLIALEIPLIQSVPNYDPIRNGSGTTPKKPTKVSQLALISGSVTETSFYKHKKHNVMFIKVLYCSSSLDSPFSTTCC